MSLYNMVCGNNPLFGAFGRIVETAGELPPIPRFRDFYTDDHNGIKLVLYTRTGGGNREDYAEQNEALRKHPLYIRDFDDTFDSTFNNFVFDVPVEYLEAVTNLHAEFSKWFKGKTPRQKFDISMDRLNDPNCHPDPACTVELQRAVMKFASRIPKDISKFEMTVMPSTNVSIIVAPNGT